MILLSRKVYKGEDEACLLRRAMLSAPLRLVVSSRISASKWRIGSARRRTNSALRPLVLATLCATY